MLLLQNIKSRKNEIIELDNRAFEYEERMALLNTRINGLKNQQEKAQALKKQFLTKRINLATAELGEIKNEMSNFSPLEKPSVLFQAIPLTKKIDSLASAKERLDAYENSIPALTKKCEARIECPKIKPGADSFVGAEVCKNCHQQAYDVWKKAIYISDGMDGR